MLSGKDFVFNVQDVPIKKVKLLLHHLDDTYYIPLLIVSPNTQGWWHALSMLCSAPVVNNVSQQF